MGKQMGGRGRQRRRERADAIAHGEWRKNMLLQVRIKRLATDHLHQSCQHLVVRVKVMKRRARRINRARGPKASDPVSQRLLLATKAIHKAPVGKPAGVVKQLAHRDSCSHRWASQGEARQVVRYRRVKFNLPGFNTLEHRQRGEGLA